MKTVSLNEVSRRFGHIWFTNSVAVDVKHRDALSRNSNGIRVK